MKRSSRLIPALDLTSEERALWIAKEIGDIADALKVNYPLVLSCSMEIVKKLSKFGDVICDFKVADIPSTNEFIVREAFRWGAKGIIVHGFVGEDAVKACIGAARGDVFIVTEMSHPGGQRFTAPVASQIAQMAVDLGAAGIVAPATRPERIAHLRKIVGDLLILSPGVGTQGGSPVDAIKNGADYVIVGRTICNSPAPRETAEKIVKLIDDALTSSS